MCIEEEYNHQSLQRSAISEDRSRCDRCVREKVRCEERRVEVKFRAFTWHSKKFFRKPESKLQARKGLHMGYEG